MKMPVQPVPFIVGALCGVAVYAFAAYAWPLVSPYFQPTAAISIQPRS